MQAKMKQRLEVNNDEKHQEPGAKQTPLLERAPADEDGTRISFEPSGGKDRTPLLQKKMASN